MDQKFLSYIDCMIKKIRAEYDLIEFKSENFGQQVRQKVVNMNNKILNF